MINGVVTDRLLWAQTERKFLKNRRAACYFSQVNFDFVNDKFQILYQLYFDSFRFSLNRLRAESQNIASEWPKWA